MGALDTRSTPTIPIPLLTSPLKGEERGDFLLFRRRTIALALPFRGRVGVGVGMPRPQLPQLSASLLVPGSRLMGHDQFGKEGSGEIFVTICLFNYGLVGKICLFQQQGLLQLFFMLLKHDKITQVWTALFYDSHFPNEMDMDSVLLYFCRGPFRSHLPLQLPIMAFHNKNLSSLPGSRSI